MSKAKELKMTTMQELREYMERDGWHEESISYVEKKARTMTQPYRWLVFRPYYRDVVPVETAKELPFGINAFVRRQPGYKRANVEIIDVSAFATTNH